MDHQSSIIGLDLTSTLMMVIISNDDNFTDGDDDLKMMTMNDYAHLCHIMPWRNITNKTFLLKNLKKNINGWKLGRERKRETDRQRGKERKTE